MSHPLPSSNQPLLRMIQSPPTPYFALRYIHHQGGAWCYSLDDCLQRSKTFLGSSKTWSPYYEDDTAYFSADEAVNPLMHNWTKVMISYCDGASFTGKNATVTIHEGTELHFRGKAILEAIQLELLKRGLQTASDVVLGGDSAGGLATYIHVDDWAQFLKSSCDQAPKVQLSPCMLLSCNC